MKLLNILLDFETSNNLYVNNRLTNNCLDALNIMNKNQSNSRGVLVRENDKIVLLPENRVYGGYIIDFGTINSDCELYIQFLSQKSSANITTQIGYCNDDVRGNLIVAKCDELMSCSLVFYAAQKNTLSLKTTVVRGVIDISDGNKASLSYVDSVLVDNHFFNYLIKTLSKTCCQIYNIVCDNQLLNDHIINLDRLDKIVSSKVHDFELSYTYNDLL